MLVIYIISTVPNLSSEDFSSIGIPETSNNKNMTQSGVLKHKNIFYSLKSIDLQKSSDLIPIKIYLEFSDFGMILPRRFTIGRSTHKSDSNP